MASRFDCSALQLSADAAVFKLAECAWWWSCVITRAARQISVAIESAICKREREKREREREGEREREEREREKRERGREREREIE
jgi:hypothetical protein